MNEDKNQDKKIVDFFYEVGMLKRFPRTGWLRAMVKNPESVADHTTRSTFVGFILAKMEGVDAKEVALICAFHELGEARISDLDKTQSSYFQDKKSVEQKAVKDQLAMLPKEMADELGHYILNEGTDNSPEQIVAKDADYIECILQAKEYLEQGYSHCQNWIDNTRKKCLKTESAKRLAKFIDEESNAQDWYKDLKRIQRLS